MKIVITYGSFDLFHEGHRRILERAKALGDYLIVGVTTEHFDEMRGKLNVIEPLLTRCMNVQNSGFCDKVITEDHVGQKLEDIIKYNVNTFAIGSDWIGEFDYLKDYTEVVYLERTKNISSSLLREQQFPIIRVGIIGTGRITGRFFSETKYVSGIELLNVYNPNIASAKRFAEEYYINYTDDLDQFLSAVDAVYIASPHETHFGYIMKALEQKKHVLCEKPMTLSKTESEQAFAYAKEQNCILMEAIKIAYAPGFVQLVGIARSGVIGSIRDIEACFTKLPYDENVRELKDEKHGGSFTELASYNLMTIMKLLGSDYKDVQFSSITADNGVDIYTKAYFTYANCFATSKTGLGVKSDGQLLISGTKGYIRAQAPWWLMKEFEVCFEDIRENQVYKTNFKGSGLRYELGEFVARINQYQSSINRLPEDESIAIAEVIEKFLSERNKSN